MKKKLFTGLIVLLIVTVVIAGLYLKNQQRNNFSEEIPVIVDNPVYSPETPTEPASPQTPVTIFSSEPKNNETLITPEPVVVSPSATMIPESATPVPDPPPVPAPVVTPPPVASPQVPPRTAELEARRGIIRGSGVNVRSTPELQLDNANRVAQAGKGTRVELLEKKREAGGGPHYWYLIRMPDGREGWVRDDLITVEE